MGRYTGKGPTAIKLTGKVGKETKEFVYEFTFPEKTGDGKEFVEALWARRKVGYMLDQIRLNGEKKELIDEVVSLAKKYGIATPYTSYLIVPDGPLPTGAAGRPKARRPRMAVGVRRRSGRAAAPAATCRGAGAGARIRPQAEALDERRANRRKRTCDGGQRRRRRQGRQGRRPKRPTRRRPPRRTPTTGRASC